MPAAWRAPDAARPRFAVQCYRPSYTVLGSKSTGKFAGATGGGTYAITILAEANLLPGKTTCSANNTGNAIAKGASITFKATGPLTLKQ